MTCAAAVAPIFISTGATNGSSEYTIMMLVTSSSQCRENQSAKAFKLRASAESDERDGYPPVF